MSIFSSSRIGLLLRLVLALLITGMLVGAAFAGEPGLAGFFKINSQAPV